MANIAQRSFGKGELAPALYGRTDQTGYATGLRTCRNFQVLKSGGVENRPGTLLVGTVPGNSLARLVPFVFNESQAYVLEFSNLLVRFIRDGGYIGSPYTVSTPYAAAELADLRFVQSADVLTIVHPNHAPATLTRSAETTWTLANITFAPAISPPTGVALVPSGSGTFIQYVVTAIDANTGQESFASTPVGFASVQLPTQRSITWNAVTGASEYNVYKGTTNNGTVATDFGFIGSTGTTTFFDSGIVADMLNRAPLARNPFVGSSNYPTAVGYYQGRQAFGGTINAPQTIWTSRSADYNNLTVSSPSQDDDALTFTLAGRRVSAIQHLHTTDKLLPFTTGGEWIVNGDSSGVLRPTDINALNYADHGCGRLAPLQLDSRTLFVQVRQSIVRDLKRDYYYGFLGTDLTTFSTHLFKGRQIVDWCYQENPESIVWCVRDDGALLGLTDVAEQQMTAWHRHDTLGAFENVCAIPEGAMDALYVVVNRSGTRYVERFAARLIDPDAIEAAIFTDATLSYDGRNATAKTLTISGGTDWTFDEPLTLTCSATQFNAGDIGNHYVVTGADGATVRIRVSAYTSTTVVTGFPQKDVPTSLRGAASAVWSRAVDQVAGLSHLEGRTVAVFADGYVVASPNNPSMSTVTVAGGIATLDQPYSVIHVGLPFVSDLETLDIDAPQGPSLKEKKINITKLELVLADSRGVFAGPQPPADETTTGLVEYKQRNTEAYGEPVALATGTISINVPGHWTTGGRVFIRQVDPLPLSVLSIIPTGHIP